MNPQIEIKHSVGNTLEIPNLLDIRAVAYTSANIAAGVTSVPVDNATDFNTSNILVLLGSMGAENAEIVVSSAHTTTALTVAATALAHTRGESVQQIAYDQIVITKSSTLTGTYSAFATVTIQVTGEKTIVYDATGLETDYYKVQWKNSISSAVSDLSDPINVANYPFNAASFLINSTLRAMGVSKNDKSITTDFMIDSLNDARTLVKAKLYGIRHAWNQEFEYPIKLLAGTNFVNLPDTIDFNETDRSLLSARFIVDNLISPFNLSYIDKRNWNQMSYQMMGSVNVGTITIGATSIVLANTGDFLDAGTVYVATDDYDQTIMAITYTANDKATNTLTGVTGVTRNIPNATQIWVRPNSSQPIYYTVWDNRIVFSAIIPDILQGNNVYIDFYKKFESINNLYDVLDEPYREIYKWYLRYAVKYRKDNSTPSDDPDLEKFNELVDALFNNLYTGQETRIITG